MEISARPDLQDNQPPINRCSPLRLMTEGRFPVDWDAHPAESSFRTVCREGVETQYGFADIKEGREST